jgi:hypothetical protein
MMQHLTPSPRRDRARPGVVCHPSPSPSTCCFCVKLFWFVTYACRPVCHPLVGVTRLGFFFSTIGKCHWWHDLSHPAGQPASRSGALRCRLRCVIGRCPTASGSSGAFGSRVPGAGGREDVVPEGPGRRASAHEAGATGAAAGPAPARNGRSRARKPRSQIFSLHPENSPSALPRRAHGGGRDAGRVEPGAARSSGAEKVLASLARVL